MKFSPKTFLFSLSLLLIANCRSTIIESTWLNNKIQIDGNAAEWNGVLQNPTDKQFGIGIMNDEKYLFICISSWDRQIIDQIMHFGFTLAFETKSGKGKLFGIHYPIGGAKPEMKQGMDENREHGPESMKEEFSEYLDKIEILGPEKNDTLPMKMMQAECGGLLLQIHYSPNGNLIYEAKIPLRQDSLQWFAIGLDKDTLVRMKCKTSVPVFGKPPSGGPSPDMARGGGGMPPGGRGGGMGGGGMPPPPGGGGMGPGGPMPGNEQEQFKETFIIKLAGKPSEIK